jgi:hypothetical protein
MNIYYVYAYLNSKTGLPYYIGKGKGSRAFDRHGPINLPKHTSLIIFMERNLTNVGALALEKRYIEWYGRKGLDPNGILVNRSIGGESGPVGVKFSEATNKSKGRPGIKRPDHSEKLKKAWEAGSYNNRPNTPCSEEKRKKLMNPKIKRGGYQGRKWYHCIELGLEACINRVPDWPSVSLGRLPKLH